MALDKLGICNEALADCPAPTIASFEEVSREAEVCAQRYGPALAYLLEMHDWKFPVVREALALVDNDRSGEWVYAYAVPEGVAAELRVFPSYEANIASVPLLTGQRLAPTHAYQLPTAALAYAYLLSGSKIYSNVGEAVLEFISEDPNTSTFPAMFARALSLELASRIVIQVGGSNKRERQGDLIKMAEVARDRAIADSRMRDPSDSRYDIFENETQLAREGFSPGGWDDGYWVTR